MNRTLVKTTAKQLKREVAGEITYQTLNAHLRKSGWSIWEFSPTNPNTKANKLIAELGIEAYANGKDSFAYCSGTQKNHFYLSVQQRQSRLVVVGTRNRAYSTKPQHR